MLKIKAGTEINQLLLIMPNKIVNVSNKKFFAKTYSHNDKISIEFYHILSNEALDNPSSMNFKNMRLIGHELLPLSKIPFNSSNVAENY